MNDRAGRNEEAGDVLRRKGFEGLVRLLPLGVDVARFAPGHPGGPPPLRIGFVGRLVPEKGVQVILDAMKNEDDWYLEVVGAGPHRTWLTEWTGELGLTDRVSFLGHASNDELPELYRQFHVVVVPSLPTPSWREQFCRVAVEAMASGVPVVCSDTGALPEVVGDAGVLFPSGDVVALHRAIKGLATDSDNRRQCAERGRLRAARYSWSAVAEQHRKLYGEVGL